MLCVCMHVLTVAHAVTQQPEQVQFTFVLCTTGKLVKFWTQCNLELSSQFLILAASVNSYICFVPFFFSEETKDYKSKCCLEFAPHSCALPPY